MILTAFAFTTGYGDIVPETDGGKLFLIPFAIIAIPSHMLAVATLGFIISDGFSNLESFITRKILKKPKRHSSHKFAFVMVVILSIVWIAMGACVHKFEHNWRLIDGLYFAFVTYSTIGYGDFITKKKGPLEYELTSWYTFIGLTLLASIIDMIFKMFKSKTIANAQNCKRKEPKEMSVVCKSIHRI